MRTCLQVSVLFLALLVLIAAARSERYVKDNVFQSSYPKLKVKIDPKFKYLGQLDFRVELPSADRLQMVSYETKSYVFANAVDNQLKNSSGILGVSCHDRFSR